MSAPATLTQIRTKVRRLTGSPSVTQLTDVQLDEYVNTFLVYDLPEELRLFNLKVEYEFYTQPNVDTYQFDRNNYLTVSTPLYIAGYEGFWSQSEEQFYRVYPQVEFIEQVATGDGSAGPYSFTLSDVPVLRGYTAPGMPDTIHSQVLISGVDAAGTNQIARDDGAGGWIDENGAPLTGTINYVTGACTVTFDNAVTGNINAQAIPYQPARPEALLFFNDIFFLRPVPDQAYKVQMEAFVAPLQLLAADDAPLLNEWWQYIAFGAAKKILEDRLDFEGVAKIMPFLDEQQRKVLRRTLVQQTQERTATIYSEQVQFPYSNWYNRF